MTFIRLPPKNRLGLMQPGTSSWRRTSRWTLNSIGAPVLVYLLITYWPWREVPLEELSTSVDCYRADYMCEASFVIRNNSLAEVLIQNVTFVALDKPKEEKAMGDFLSPVDLGAVNVGNISKRGHKVVHRMEFKILPGQIDQLRLKFYAPNLKKGSFAKLTLAPYLNTPDGDKKLRRLEIALPWDYEKSKIDPK